MKNLLKYGIGILAVIVSIGLFVAGVKFDKEWIIALDCAIIGAIIGAILGYLLTLAHDRRQTGKRKEQYVREIQLLTSAVLTQAEVCNNSIEEYRNNLKSAPHELHPLNQGVLVSIERLAKLDATMVYEAFESKGKREDFNTFLNLIDQLLTAYTLTYEDYDEHDKDTASDINKFDDVEELIRQACNATSTNPMMKKIIAAYNEEHNKQKEMTLDIKLEYDTLIIPLKTYLELNDKIPTCGLLENVERAEYLYQSICWHQRQFAAHLERRLKYINQTIEAIKKVML